MRVYYYLLDPTFFLNLHEFINCLMELLNTSMNNHTIERKEKKRVENQCPPHKSEFHFIVVVESLENFVEEGANLFQGCASCAQIACQFTLGEQSCVNRIKGPIQPKRKYCKILQTLDNCQNNYS